MAAEDGGRQNGLPARPTFSLAPGPTRTRAYLEVDPAQVEGQPGPDKNVKRPEVN